jgi:hypothetical protein
METQKSFNFSFATSTIKIKPDAKRIKQYDLYYKKYLLISIILGVLSSLAIYFTYSLYASSHYIWGSILGLITLILLFFTSATYKSSRPGVYNSGLLTSAVIVNESPLYILALANLESTNPDKVTLGCQKLDVKDLPGHTIRVGERIPCISMFGGSDGDLHANFEPRPICWATERTSDIEDAISKIEDDEWEILERLIVKAKDLKTDTVFKLDADLNFIVTE